MARLDRVAPVKEVAQIAACIGREFSCSLLAAISPLPDAELQDALQQLGNSEIVFRRGSPPDATYGFKHALVRDSAYESLLNSRRQQVHAQLAQTLGSQSPDAVKAHAELVALHFTKAGMVDEALPRWVAAPQSAAATSRYREALSHVESGLSIVTGAAADRRVNLETALLVTGRFCHAAVAGYASELAAGLFARVEALLDRVTDQDVLFSALWGVGALAWVTADFPKTLATYERLAALAEQTGDVDRLMLGYFCLGTLLHQVAQFDRGRQLPEFVVDHYDAERHSRVVYTMGLERPVHL